MHRVCHGTQFVEAWPSLRNVAHSAKFDSDVAPSGDLVCQVSWMQVCIICALVSIAPAADALSARSQISEQFVLPTLIESLAADCQGSRSLQQYCSLTAHGKKRAVTGSA